MTTTTTAAAMPTQAAAAIPKAGFDLLPLALTLALALIAWPPESLPAGYNQNFFRAGNRPNSHSSRAVSICSTVRALRAASSRFSRTVRSLKMPMFSGT